MKLTVVRYKTKPDAAQENERLIKQVFQELQAKLHGAEQERDEVRRLIIEHEQSAHPDTKLSFSE